MHLHAHEPRGVGGRPRRHCSNRKPLRGVIIPSDTDVQIPDVASGTFLVLHMPKSNGVGVEEVRTGTIESMIWTREHKLGGRSRRRRDPGSRR